LTDIIQEFHLTRRWEKEDRRIKSMSERKTFSSLDKDIKKIYAKLDKMVADLRDMEKAYGMDTYPRNDRHLEEALRQNRNLYEDNSFAVNVSKFINGTINRTKPIVVGVTPYVLNLAGAKQDIDVTINISTLKKCMSEPDEYYHGHALSEEIIKKIPEEIRNPVMILSGSQDNTIIEISQLQDNENREIIIAIELSKNDGFNEVNRITSIYGKDKFKNYIEKQLSEDKLIAANKEKTDEMLHSLGLQLPQENTFISYDDSITYSAQDVKYPVNEKNITEQMDYLGYELVKVDGFSDDGFLMWKAKDTVGLDYTFGLDGWNATKEFIGKVNGLMENYTKEELVSRANGDYSKIEYGYFGELEINTAINNYVPFEEKQKEKKQNEKTAKKSKGR
jgi:hypothetical protein